MAIRKPVNVLLFSKIKHLILIRKEVAIKSALTMTENLMYLGLIVNLQITNRLSKLITQNNSKSEIEYHPISKNVRFPSYSISSIMRIKMKVTG